MPSDLGEVLDRWDPARLTRTLARRDRSDLPFDAAAVPASLPVMLDTTVYIDGLQGKLPTEVAALIVRNVVLHGATGCAELAVSIGHLDPGDPRTPATRDLIAATLRRMMPSRVIPPSAAAWTEAGLVAGLLARTQGYPRENRRALLNDALLFFTALEAGSVLISRNVRHVDLLLQLRDDAAVLLYDRP